MRDLPAPAFGASLGAPEWDAWRLGVFLSRCSRPPSVYFGVAVDLDLECLSKPLLQEAPADEDATDQEEGLVDVVTAFVADGETPETRQPRERAFDHPAVAAEALARFDSAPRDAALDPSPLQVRAAVPVVDRKSGV